jgi:ATP-dependent Clp protease ATP-binding subunit ClpC
MFKPLTQNEIEEIVRLVLKSTEERLKDQEIQIEFDQSVIKEIASKSYTPQFGARPIKRAVQREIENLLSEEILQNRVQIKDHIRIVFKNKRFEIEKEN